MAIARAAQPSIGTLVSTPAEPDSADVAVVIATYNRSALLKDCLRSLQEQTVAPSEIIVVDDGSNDDTLRMIRDEFPATRVISQENAERGAARNRGALASAASYLNFIDSDDLVLPSHIAQFARMSHGDATIYGGPFRVGTPESWRARPVTVHPESLLQSALFATAVALQTLFIPRSVFLDVGQFPSERELAGSEDWYLLARLASLAPIAFYDEPTVLVREHPGRSMNSLEWAIESRFRAADKLLREGLVSRPLTPTERQIVACGAHRFAAANFYGHGQMVAARSEIRQAVRVHPVVGARRSMKLLLQTFLPPRLAEILRSHGPFRR